MTTRKTKQIDETTTDAALRSNYALQLESLVEHPGWKILADIMQANVDRIEEIIITRRLEGSDTKLSDQELEEYRIQHAQLKQTLSLPGKLARSMRQEEDNRTEAFDPYDTTGDAKVERRKKCASTLKEA